MPLFLGLAGAGAGLYFAKERGLLDDILGVPATVSDPSCPSGSVMSARQALLLRMFNHCYPAVKTLRACQPCSRPGMAPLPASMACALMPAPPAMQGSSAAAASFKPDYNAVRAAIEDVLESNPGRWAGLVELLPSHALNPVQREAFRRLSLLAVTKEPAMAGSS